MRVVDIPSAGSIPDNGLCALYGQYRYGPASEIFGALQRVAISRDGRTVLFEINHDHALIQSPLVVPEQGIYRVQVDGSAMRRLRPASRYPPFKVFASPNPPGFSVATWSDISFSPNGRFVVFTDRGPGADGSDAVQLFVMDVESGAQTQLTRFIAASQGNASAQEVGGSFIDDDTVALFSAALQSAFTVKRDGTDLRPFSEDVIPIPGAHVLPMFQVAGRPRLAFPVELPKPTSEPFPGTVTEIFARTDNKFLQLTDFGRSDTTRGVTNHTGRVFFLASADRLGRNRSQTCQLFSIGSLGDDLRQITRFDAPPSTLAGGGGCIGAGLAPSCQIAFAQPLTFDPLAEALIFDTTCDPFGTNPLGTQFFAVRGDGSGLRELTNYRGMQVAPDGTVTVELPGPSASPGREG